MLGVRQTATRGEAKCLGPDKHQIQQGILALESASEGGCNGHGFLKNLALPIGTKRVEDQGVADEEFILEFLYHGFSGFGPTAPVNVAERVTRPVIAQGSEFFGFSNRRG